MDIKIKDLITDKISGEWGEELINGIGTNIIRTTNFTNLGTINFSNIVQRKIDQRKIEQKQLIQGDVIIEKSGGSPTQPVGRVVYFDLEIDEIYLCNNFTAVLRPNKLKIYPKYFFYQLFIGHIRGKTLKYQNKTTGIINLKLDNYINEKIFVPSMRDQIRIAEVLTKVETLIKQRKESIDLLDVFLRSTFLDMFGDPVKNEKKWEKEPLNKFGKIITGNTPPRNNLNNFSEEHIEWIKTDNILLNETFLTKSKEYLSKEGLSKSRFVDKGALLVACIAGSIESVGRASLTDRKVSFNQQINAIQPNDNVNSYFLYWLFKISRVYIQNHSTKGMKKILTKGIFEKILMIRPSIDLQNKFASIVEKAANVKEYYQASLKELENLFGSLSQKAFKGELDLSKMRLTEMDNEFPKTISNILTPQMQEFIKKTSELEKIIPKTATVINSDIYQQIAGQNEVLKQLSNPFKGIPELPESIRHALKTYEKIKSITSTLNEVKKSTWSSMRDIGELEGLEFDEIEGLALIEMVLSKNNTGFTFADFETLLQKEKFKYNYKQIQQFIFKLIAEKKLSQHFLSNKKENRLLQIEDENNEMFFGDELIWLNYKK
jgi:type I restriction enzyme, S subunit